MPVEDAKKGRSVRVSGVVNFARPGWFGFYVESEDGAIYCDSPQPSTWPQPGDLVEVEGFTAMAYRPFVRARSVRILGRAALPDGKLVSLKELDKDEHDARRIRVQGRIKRVSMADQSNRLLLTQDGQDLDVFLHGMSAEDMQALTFAEVECRGSLGRLVGLDGKESVRFLTLNSTTDLTVLRSAKEVTSSTELIPLSEMVTNPVIPMGLLVRTKGVVNYFAEDAFWIGADGLGLLVRLPPPADMNIGDSVEVIGFVGRYEKARTLDPARRLSSSAGIASSPRRIDKAGLSDWRNHGSLVSIDADLAASTPTRKGELLLLVTDHFPFQARFKFPTKLAPTLQLGSVVSLTGILFLETPPGETTPVSRILLRSPADIRLLTPPPWPMAKTLRVVTGLSIALGVGLFSIAGGYLWLRRAHGRALTNLAKEGQRLEEAQRIARIGSWEWDVETGVNVWSDENYRLFGFSPGEVQPCYDRFVASLHPDDRERVLTSLQATLQRDVPYDVECRIIYPTGTTRYVQCRGEVERDRNGKAIRMQGTVLDITDRRRVERRDQLQAKALERLAKGCELSVVLGQLIEAVETDHETWRCCVMVTDTTAQRLSCIASGLMPPFFREALQGLEIGLRAGVCGQAAARKEPIYVANVEKEEGCQSHLPLFQKAGLRACWSYPILSSTGAALGTFSVFHRAVLSPTPTEIQDLAHTANLASIAIEDRRNEEARRASEKLLQEAQAIAHVGSFYWNAVTNKVTWSRELYRIFGRDPAQFEPTFDSYIAVVHEEDRATVVAGIRTAMATKQSFSHDYRAVLANGEQRLMQARGRVVLDASGTVIGLEGTCQDLTERKQLEAQVRHIQKMEAIGTLAGGIAHDFNNLLSSILGNTYLAQLDLERDHPARESILAIEQAGNRAKALVRQILSFSRQQDPQRQVLDLSPIVAEVASMLRATLPAGVELAQVVSPDTPKVLADATQIHQVLVNLCTNAWHALENDRGRIEIRLQSLVVPPRATPSEGQLRAGHYACISVTDTGRGMDAATMERIFDPFFTTKGPGKGTGLGLAVVHGIVESHDGTIRVSSQPHHGTTFHIYLPAAEVSGSLPQQAPAGIVQGRGERVLFVDDEAALAEIATRMLKHLGYQAETHTRQTDALNALRKNPQAFDLVITDLNMPGSSGLEFADAVRKVRPGIPIVLSSGHVTDDLMQRARGVGIVRVLHKPASIQELSECMTQLLTPEKT